MIRSASAPSVGLGATAVCYVTDTGFLFPSIASALSLRANNRGTSGAGVGIFIFTIGIAPDALVELNARLAVDDIRLIDLPNRWSARFDAKDFGRFNPVPDATLGRFFMEPHVPEGFDRLLYIDGDTLILGDISDLLVVQVPPGGLAAVEDPIGISAQDDDAFGAFVRTYLAQLGLEPTGGYFNAGVFLTDRATWRTLAAQAFEFFLDDPARCVFHDQSALNVIARDRRLTLSLRWNTMTFHKDWGADRVTPATIRHFSGPSKPWTGRIWPYGPHAAAYAAARALVPVELAPSRDLGSLGSAQASLRNLKSAAMRLTRDRQLLQTRTERMARYEANATGLAALPGFACVAAKTSSPQRA